MSSNRRRNANLLPVARILLVGTLLLTVGGGALFYVNAKNEVHRNGQRKKELERELLALETKDEVITSRIAKLSSFDSLRRRQVQERDVFAKLVPVTDNLVVRLQDKVPTAGESQVRTVSNLQPAR
ncbi:MAG: hypothetical protein DVB28_000568 [Verrucomicrobia bacterium]|nr:MAG: hypothetical protein DVB28_000568 [Verrucomicrobiota bacterium]